MLKYSLKRLLRSFFTLIIVITVVFLLMRLMPEEGYFGDNYEKLDEAQREAILTNIGLRDPLHIQLKNFYTSLLSGDLGTSIIYRPKMPIIDIVKTKMPYSVYFGLAAMALSLVFGITLGIAMARSKNKFWDKFGTGYIVIINAVPAAVYYLFFQLYCSDIFKLPILFNADNPKSWILPAVSMSLGGSASYAMWMRRYMVDELNKDYVKLARAKGLRSKKIMTNHVLKNAFVPMAQYLPASILFTISGSIYIESLYSIPGMGGLLVDAIQRQDNPLVQALVLIYSSIGIIGLFLGDILMVLLDPRIKLDKGEGAR
ncbi:ABC-type transporter, integral membrane subunit [Tepidanaerobacter acetatoxydans Re1]|uniref:ABC-type transporter, integral membrane subunit n=1 Tax=Tepidanaerobacter acetatoxydans (strain DSM 21804 / JCM 16047 / Re1) TaxID=1209989 RepID=F4LWY7_TEPAE|nr:ABC transporter permease [Tepidanaerobacter acetatoxydans]AEE90965.1 ABC-type transporter, integral membrane subunit [Tepidanaerobacter acetatoxydans Re1]CDI40494.1 ABC-type transporter, integral membrane subunit [Tepidanaerobacter acetatoxydans Re1]